MKRLSLVVFVLLPALIGILSCGRKTSQLKSYPLDNLDGVIARDHIAFDKDISADGKGSIHVQATEPVTIPLFNITDLKIDDTGLVYTAKVRTERIIGQVFLEMACYFPNRDKILSLGQETLLSGTNDWKEQKLTSDIQKGQQPDSIRLNLVINGRGAAWIDDIKLLREPYRPAPSQPGR